MIPKDSVEKYLSFYLEFNYVEGSDDYHLEVSDFDDTKIHWTSSSFKHEHRLTVLADNNKLVIFNTKKTQELLLGNLDKIIIETPNFSCEPSLVKDVILGGLRMSPLTHLDDELMANFRKERDRATQRILNKEESTI